MATTQAFVRLRIDQEDHVVVQHVAGEELRNLTDQYRKIVKEWAARVKNDDK